MMAYIFLIFHSLLIMFNLVQPIESFNNNIQKFVSSNNDRITISENAIRSYYEKD
jgi:hypothetical protein